MKTQYASPVPAGIQPDESTDSRFEQRVHAHAFSEHSSTKFNTLVLNLVVKETVPLLFIYFDLPLLFYLFLSTSTVLEVDYYAILSTSIRILS